MAIPKPRGRSPKPESQRRRRNKPTSHGLAEPVVAGAAAAAPELGFKAHELVASMWAALSESVESQFFSDADWQRERWELWHANQLLTGHWQMTSAAWNAVQRGLSDLLVSPADKRRAGIEMQPPGADTDEVAAVSMLSRYRRRLKPV